jgi:K+ transporter
MSHVSTQKISLAGLLITTGIVFGDIGTSPLYVFQAITGGGKHISEPFILGALSSVIWTLILLATIKYIFFNDPCEIILCLRPKEEFLSKSDKHVEKNFAQ